MLSCGEIVLSSDAEVQEFYSLAKALGMDRDNEGSQQKKPCQLQEEESKAKDTFDVQKEVNQVEEDETASEEKEDLQSKNKFEELKYLVSSAKVEKGEMIPCPLSGCKAKRQNASAILIHLCHAHFRPELMKRRETELEIVSSSDRIECLECGAVKSTIFNLVAHYGVTHQDLAEVALETVALEVRKSQENNEMQLTQDCDKENQSGGGDDGGNDNETSSRPSSWGRNFSGDEKQKARKLKKLCRSSSSGFECFLCPKGSTHLRYFSRLLQHLSVTHFPRRLIDLHSPDQGEGPNGDHLGDHQYTATWTSRKGAMPVRCTECGRSISSVLNMVQHYGVVHGQVVSMALKMHKQNSGVPAERNRPLPAKKKGTKSTKGRKGSATGRDEAKCEKLKSLCPKAPNMKKGLCCPFCTHVNSNGFKGLLQHMTVNHFRAKIISKRPELKKAKRFKAEADEDSRVWRCQECPSRFISRILLVCHYGSVHGDVLDPALQALKGRARGEPALVKTTGTEREQKTNETGGGPFLTAISRQKGGEGRGKKAPPTFKGTPHRDEEKCERLKSLCERNANGTIKRCPLCFEVCHVGSFSSLLKHLALSHFRTEITSARQPRPVEEDGDGKRWHCRECPSKFDSVSLVVCHYGSVHGDVLDLAIEALTETKEKEPAKEEEPELQMEEVVSVNAKEKEEKMEPETTQSPPIATLINQDEGREKDEKKELVVANGPPLRDEAKCERLQSFCPRAADGEGRHCPFCSQVFPEPFSNLLRHITAAHFESEVCAGRPDALADRRAAGGEEEDPRVWTWCCQECRAMFRDRTLLVCHYGDTHGDVLDPALQALQAALDTEVAEETVMMDMNDTETVVEQGLVDFDAADPMMVISCPP